MKKGYKRTEIGVIPEDWEVKKIGDIAPLQRGFDLPNRYLQKGYFPVVYSNGILNYHNKFLAKAPGIVTGRSGTIGKVSYVENDYWPHNTTLWVTDFKNNYPKFVYYSFQHIRLERFASGSGVPTLNRNDVHNYRIVIPKELPEQKAIAEVLSDTDNLIQALEKLIAKKRLIKQGAMQKLLTPKDDWEVKKLGEVAEIKMGQSPSSSNYNNSGIGLPLVQGNADIKNRKTIIRNYTSQITKKCNTGDIIMSVRAPVGEIARAIFEACIGRGVCAIFIPNNFLYHYLIFIEPQWAKHSTGSTFYSVNSDTIRELEIPFPSKQEQTHIATILSDMDSEIEALEKKLAKYQQLKQGLMQNLLTGKIRLI